MVVKCIACCVSLFVGLILSILQITEKERKLGLLGTPREIWDFCNKDKP
jgi:flagellar biosynthesis protein FliQ